MTTVDYQTPDFSIIAFEQLFNSNIILIFKHSELLIQLSTESHIHCICCVGAMLASINTARIPLRFRNYKC